MSLKGVTSLFGVNSTANARIESWNSGRKFKLADVSTFDMFQTPRGGIEASLMSSILCLALTSESITSTASTGYVFIGLRSSEYKRSCKVGTGISSEAFGKNKMSSRLPPWLQLICCCGALRSPDCQSEGAIFGNQTVVRI